MILTYVDYCNYKKLKKIKDYVDSITNVGFEQIISYAMRDSPMHQSILDHVYVPDSMLDKVIMAAVIEYDLSDHYPIVLHLKTSILRFEEKRPEMRKSSLKRLRFLFSHLRNG